MTRPSAVTPLTPEALGHVRGVTFTVPAGVFRAMLTGLQRHPGQLIHGDLGLRRHPDRVEFLCRSWGLVHAGDVYAHQRSPQPSLTYTVETATLAIGRPQVWRLLALTAGPAPPAPPTLQVVLGSGREAGLVTGLLRSGGPAVPLHALTLPGVARIGTVDFPVEAPPVAAADRARWSRLLGALGEAAWSTLTSCTYCLIGVGRLGALLALSLAKAGVRTLTLVDPGRLAPQHLEMDGVTPQDLGRLKVPTLGAWLRQVCPHTTVHLVPYRLDTPAGMEAARAADVLMTCTSTVPPRVLAAALAWLDLKPLLDIGTRVWCNTVGTAEVEAHIRLLLPGEGCLHCGADRTRLAPVPSQGVGGPAQARGSALAGAWRSVHQMAAHLGLTQVEHLVAGRLLHATWLRLHWEAGGLPTLQSLPLAACTPPCPLGELVGRGDGLVLGQHSESTGGA